MRIDRTSDDQNGHGRILRSPCGLGLLVMTLLFSGQPAKAAETALDRYVAQPDPSYKWEVVREIPGPGVTSWVLKLTSQTWRKAGEVDRTVWEHWLIVTRPDEVKHDEALLMIGGGNNKDEKPPGKVDPFFLRLAAGTQSVVAYLGMVPNQPLVFENDGKGRYEDDLIGWTWSKFLETGDENWPARLPMVKSVVRAMDAVQAFCRTEQGKKTRVERFVVAGGSKRGWTTWMTASVDKRVAAIIPIVIDVLNVVPSMKHHHAAYGFWAPAIGDYVNHDIPGRLDDPRMKELMAIEDPYEVRERFKMPKFVINATGDQFFLPDSWKFYFDAIPGEKYVRYVANGDHSLKDTDATESVAAYYHAIINDRPRPRFAWKVRDDGSIVVDPADRPKEVVLWQAVNPDARDFRVDTIGRTWKRTVVPRQSFGRYRVKVEPPKRGWIAFMVELTFESGTEFPFKFTTGVKVLPETLPFKDKPLDAYRTEKGEKDK